MDETRIITTEGLTTCLDPGRGWTIASRGWSFLKKQKCWEDHEQALITIIRKETRRSEELEEAGYRSPTWAVLRALQQMNSATRIEGEAAMSAPPFFQSAGRGDLLFWGGEEEPTVVIWETQKIKDGWKRRARCTTGSCGASPIKGRRKSVHLSSLGKKSSLTMMKRNRKRKTTKRRGAKRRHIEGRAYDTGPGGSKATSKWQ